MRLYSYTPYLASAALLSGLISFATLADAQTKKMESKHDHSTHQHTDICAGFVILPNGYAVLSAMDPGGMHHGGGHHQAGHQGGMANKKGMGDKAHKQHGMADKKGMDHKQHAQHDGGMKQADPLMGHQHGDDISTDKEMLCVPIGDMQSTSWTSVSASPNMHITAKSDKGVLAHNSRANESLSLNIMRDGKPIDPAKVRVVVRMPHHDRRMPGGHGPANDPDVQGFEAMPKGKGVYTLPTVDFSMGGPWLFEVHVQDGGAMSKAYFASEVGEE